MMLTSYTENRQPSNSADYMHSEETLPTIEVTTTEEDQDSNEASSSHEVALITDLRSHNTTMRQEIQNNTVLPNPPVLDSETLYLWTAESARNFSQFNYSNVQ